MDGLDFGFRAGETQASSLISFCNFNVLYPSHLSPPRALLCLEGDFRTCRMAEGRQMDFRIRQLQCFLTLAELLHYGRTARALYMSQPTITFQIKSLEQAFGVPLFERNRQQVSLSAAGVEFRPYAQKVVDTVRDAQSRLVDLGGELRLKISCGAIGQAVLLPTILRALSEKYPGFDLKIGELTTEQQISGLVAGTVDALLMVEELPVRGMRFDCLREEALVAILSRRSPLAGQRTVSVEDMRGISLVVPRLEDSSVRQPFLLGMLGEYGVVPRFVEAPHSLSAQLAYVAAGKGVIIGTRHRAAGRSAEIVVRPFREKLPRLRLGLASMGSNDSAAMNIFREIVLGCNQKGRGRERSEAEKAVLGAEMC